MDNQEKGIRKIQLTSEMKTSFMNYAMSVIVARALPDVRDGMKPVQRRIVYILYTLFLIIIIPILQWRK